MNLITRTIPVLILGLSGLTLSTASQADSSFNITFSSGYTVPQVSYAYYNGYRSYVRPHRPPVHVDTYVEKHVYRSNRYYDEHREYRRNDHPARRRHTGYARISHY